VLYKFTFTLPYLTCVCVCVCVVAIPVKSCAEFWLSLLQWDAVSREYQLHSIQSEHKKTITAISWCPHDVDIIVSVGADLAVIIWNVAEQQVVSSVILSDGTAVPCSVTWGLPNRSGVAFIGKRGPLMMWFSVDESEQNRVTAVHSEIRGFSSDVCQMRCHTRQRDRVALGHVDGSISVFATGKCPSSATSFERYVKSFLSDTACNQ